MFQFVDDESDVTFKAKVVVNHPAHGRSEFTAEFLLVEQAEYDDLARQGDTAIIERVLTGWGEDLRGADKKPLPFCNDVLQAMCRRAYVRTAIVQAYIKGFMGARQGN